MRIHNGGKEEESEYSYEFWPRHLLDNRRYSCHWAGFYFLTRIDIAPPTSSTASIINDTTQAEETLPPMLPSTFLQHRNVHYKRLPFGIGNKDGTCLKITVHGKVLKYGGGDA
jgi:hypothetical protein